MITLTAGHNPMGKVAIGSVGILNESTENRVMVKELKYWLDQEKELNKICTVDDGVSQQDILVRSIDRIKSIDGCLDIHIHFNASSSHDTKEDGKVKGTEIFVDENCNHLDKAKKILDAMVSVGFTNRGIKDGSHLYVVRKRPKTTLFIEVCFVDDADDVKLYNKITPKEIARLIVGAILNREVIEEKEEVEEKETTILLKTLNEKDSGPMVLSAQVLLNAKGQKGKNGKELTLDGKFGENTRTAVESLQRKYKIPVTGKVDFQTWNKLLK